MAETIPLRARVEGGGTPLMKNWYLKSETGPLKDVLLGPAESFRVSWREDAPGTWLYHCHVEQHMEKGMIGIYQVSR